jgi:hypothetical protein
MPIKLKGYTISEKCSKNGYPEDSVHLFAHFVPEGRIENSPG